MAYRIIVIGTSLGGLQAMETLLSGLTDQFPIPIAVVQHRQKDFHETMQELLSGHCDLTVTEAADKQAIEAGHVYLAPPDYHLLVDDDHFSLSIDPPVSYSRPSIDVLFSSAADVYGPGVIGVLLTGANFDGARGLARVKLRGGVTVVHDPATAAAPEMPLAAIKTGQVDKILPLDDIAPFLVDLCEGP